jgi:DNA polymerase-3 subunit epsilon
MIDLRTPIDEVALAFLDVETTGLNPGMGDRVCEIAILRCQGDDVIDAIEQLINPQRRMGAGALAVHGLDDQVLAAAPPFVQVVDRILDALEGAVLVGHNTPFDLGFLATELGRIGIKQPRPVALDTLRLARYSYRLSSYALHRVATALGIDVAGRAHRAMHDVLLTRTVFSRLQTDLYPLGIRTLGDYVRAQGGHLELPAAPVFDVPPLIQQALQDSLILRVHYLSEQGVETVRLVRPLAISLRGGRPSLVAHCYLRDARRNFRLDRILDLELVQEWVDS